jgi:arylsulfatase A
MCSSKSLLCGLGLAAALWSCGVGPARPVAMRPPNVLVVLVDDLGIGDLGCFNAESRIPTPNLDALAAESVRCVDAHSPSSVCSPTRYALLTGRYAWRSRLKNGVLWGTDPLLIEPGRPTIASVLADAGYRTACFGKWHLGLGSYDPNRPDGKVEFGADRFDAGPHTVGFHESMVIPSSLDIPPYVYVVDGRPEAAPTAQTAGSKRRWSGGGGFWRKGAMQPAFSFTDVVPRFVRRAQQFLVERASEPEQPWLCYLPLPTPHTPWVPTAKFEGATEVGYYGDFVAELDAHIGALLDTLAQTGQAEETIVVFTSDNGSHWRPVDVERYSHDAHLGFRGMKADIHEAGHRVPLLVRWPQVLQPGTCDDLIGLQDFYAGLTGLVSASAGGGEDSHDALAVLRGALPARDELVHHSVDGMFALRSGRWKWIEGRGSGGFTAPRREPDDGGAPPGQLYDLVADRGEREDLVLDEERLVRRLRLRLRELRSGR